MQFNKQPKSISDQITQLINRGLLIDDLSEAEHYLSNVSYYRLSAYTHPFQIHNDPEHNFKPNVHFSQIIDLYLFDRDLRLLVYDVIERVEIALRTQIVYQYSLAYGAWWFEDPQHFNTNYLYSKNLSKLDEEIERSGEVFIRHFKNKYTNPARPPAWMTLEVSSMGLLSKIYRDLKMTAEKKKIAKHFGVNPYVLESWMQSISYVRNICAHHSRLWNRVLTLKPMLPKTVSHQWLNNVSIDNSKLYAFLSCMLYMLQSVSPGNSFTKDFKALIVKHSSINLNKMGFPTKWETEPLWV